MVVKQAQPNLLMLVEILLRLNYGLWGSVQGFRFFVFFVSFHFVTPKDGFNTRASKSRS